MEFRRDFTVAVIEAKSADKNSADGLQQGKEYAEILGLKCAYSTNGDAWYNSLINQITNRLQS